MKFKKIVLGHRHAGMIMGQGEPAGIKEHQLAWAPLSDTAWYMHPFEIFSFHPVAGGVDACQTPPNGICLSTSLVDNIENLEIF